MKASGKKCIVVLLSKDIFIYMKRLYTYHYRKSHQSGTAEEFRGALMFEKLQGFRDSDYDWSPGSLSPSSDEDRVCRS